MPVTIREQRKQDWTIGDYGDAERKWKVFGTLDITEAKNELLLVADATWLDLFRNDAKIRVTEAGYKAWDASVPYTPYDLTGGGTPPTVFSFRTSGGSQKITQTGAGTVKAYAAAGFTAADDDCGGGINANKSGGFDGVDIVSPIFDFEMESYLPAASVNNAFIAMLISLTAKTNSAPFRGCAAGEVLYVGAQGTQERGGSYRLTHGFKASPNKTNVSLAAGQISGVTKKGWEYVWVNYISDKKSGRPTLKAKAAFVHTTYSPGDFTLLGV